MKHLVLFDIDGTLLRCGPQVRPLFVGALRSVFGVHGSLEGFTFAGKTDPQIVLELIGATGRADHEIAPRLDEMRRVYHARLDAGLRAERMTLLPGVVPLLERLGARDDVTIGLLTGNWRVCAGVKLGRFDLGRHFTFGAYGDDAVDRRELVPVALERAEASAGRRFAPAETLIIGDSERDVDCARAGGARSLAVATGFSPEARLRRAGADWVFPDLAEAAAEHPLLAG